MPEGEAIEHPLVTRSLESAQRKVEGRNFDIRKQLLEYDDVANDQRRVIYQQRNELLESTDIAQTITAMRHSVLAEIFRRFVPENSVEEQWEIDKLEAALKSELLLDLPIALWVQNEAALSDEDILARIIQQADSSYNEKVAMVGNLFHSFERNVMLQSLDAHWREHLAAMDHLRQGIHLRGYAQKNPKQEYKKEAFALFELLLDSVRREVTKITFTVQLAQSDNVEDSAPSKVHNVQYHHDSFEEQDDLQQTQNESQAKAQPYRAEDIPGRNAPCPCGSGKKYKHCHGKLK